MWVLSHLWLQAGDYASLHMANKEALFHFIFRTVKTNHKSLMSCVGFFFRKIKHGIMVENFIYIQYIKIYIYGYNSNYLENVNICC